MPSSSITQNRRLFWRRLAHIRTSPTGLFTPDQYPIYSRTAPLFVPYSQLHEHAVVVLVI